MTHLQNLIMLSEARLHTALGFTQLEKLIPTTEDLHPRVKRASRFYNMRTWKTRMTASFGRSWDRAWGATKGTATISLTLKNVSGTTSPLGMLSPFLPKALFLNFMASRRGLC